jgi:hypothetical protein
MVDNTELTGGEQKAVSADEVSVDGWGYRWFRLHGAESATSPGAGA